MSGYRTDGWFDMNGKNYKTFVLIIKPIVKSKNE
jgi:hypothetical protein